LTDFARVSERLLRIGERSFRITKHPKSHRPIGQDCHPDVLAKSQSQRAMFGAIIKCGCPIKVRSPWRDVPCTRQGSAHKPMSDDERHGRTAAAWRLPPTTGTAAVMLEQWPRSRVPFALAGML
jgi:hypothetical protein